MVRSPHGGKALRLAVAAVAASSSLAMADAAVGQTTDLRRAVFGGKTSQGYPVVFRFSSSGSRLAMALTALDYECESGGVLTFPDEFAGLRVSRAGTFNRTFDPPGVVVDPNVTVDLRTSIRGRLDARRRSMTGTWSADVTITTAGVQTDTCRTGVVKYRATR